MPQTDKVCNDYADGFVDGYRLGGNDREEEVLHYLVWNGYIKYGFDEKYLAEQLEKERKNEETKS